ncbi:MAG: hypothetical protein M3Y26_08690 [Actinomycetota bacterium]|nr:hypothetical protein [Actinomycetota bacterium]
MRPARTPVRRLSIALAATVLTLTGLVATSTSASALDAANPGSATATATPLRPRIEFTMAADGSSGATQGGAGIPNIDSDKKTIYTYYGDPGTGHANMTSSPYISEMASIAATQTAGLKAAYDQAVSKGQKPAIVLDTDDTTLMTYDMEVAAMHFNFDPVLQNTWVQEQLFPATPSMVQFANTAAAMGYTVFGLTGRNDDQKAATVANLSKVGYNAFTAGNFYTKWTGVGASQQPAYVTCAAVKCTTVEYKASTRKHIENDLGYTIALNVGDQWSDLQGGFAGKTVKLPNPTYYLPSTNLPGVSEPKLAPRSHFWMKPDGSSGAVQSGEGIPNIDSVKKTISTYYGDPGTGIADKTTSPYITEMASIVRSEIPRVAFDCFVGRLNHKNPAVILDTDDTTLWTYDMEVAAMHFNFDPVLQNVWVQDERFPATPHMVSLARVAQLAGCTVIGLTGRNDDQKAATLANLARVGYPAFTAANFYTKWTGVGTSQQPAYITCAAVKCTTIEYKSQTRAHIEAKAGGNYDIVANFGDQFSDLLGYHADRTIKLPNPTYYLP